MMDEFTNESTNAPEGNDEVEIPAELIREIADKVYLLLVQRLQIERERNQLLGDENSVW
jgi:hypothetical protein